MGTSFFRFVLISVAGCGLASAQPVLIAPTPCEALDVKPASTSEKWTKVYFENRTDATLHIFRLFPDGRRSEVYKRVGITGLSARYASPLWGRPGAVWVVEDGAGKCLGGYTAGTQEGRVKIGDKELRVRLNVPPFRMKTVVFAGFGVKPDRDEEFIDSPNVSSTVCDGLNLWIGARTTPDSACSGPAKAESDRYLEFDLRQAVPASGAKPLGVIRDPKAALHVFLGRGPEQKSILSIQELLPGKEAQSERIELVVSIDGLRHMLLVGPWGPGQFNKNQKKPLHGQGTSRATVKRLSNTVWEALAPEGTVGRLWNNADTANPIDRGLYQISFRFRFELLPETVE